MKAYVITKGDYSDYHICGVSLDKEKAGWLAKCKSDAYDVAQVEEFEIDEGVPIELYKLYPVYKIVTNEKGEITNSYLTGWTADLDAYEPKYIFETNSSRTNLYRINVNFTARVAAEDEEHAKKIALDQRAKMLAEMLGL